MNLYSVFWFLQNAELSTASFVWSVISALAVTVVALAIYIKFLHKKIEEKHNEMICLMKTVIADNTKAFNDNSDATRDLSQSINAQIKLTDKVTELYKSILERR